MLTSHYHYEAKWFTEAFSVLIFLYHYHKEGLFLLYKKIAALRQAT